MRVLLDLYPGDSAAILAANVLAQSVVLTLLAWVLAATAGRRRPAIRHAIWLTALLGVLLSPAASALMTHFDFFLFRVPLDASGASRPSNASKAVLTHAEGIEGPAAVELFAPETSRPEVVGVESGAGFGDSLRAGIALLALLWLVGVVALSIRFAHGWRLLSRLRRQGRPLDEERYRLLIERAGAAVGARRLPLVAVCASDVPLAGPLALGVVRPLILLPQSVLATLDGPALVDVLTHEMAHLVRRDSLVGLLQRVAAVLYWPWPPIRFLNGQLSRAREEVCDNYVLQQGCPSRYAETLFRLARTVRSAPLKPVALGLFTSRWRLDVRVAGLLDARRNVMVRTRRSALVALTVLFAVAVLFVAGVGRPEAAPPESPSESARGTHKPQAKPDADLHWAETAEPGTREWFEKTGQFPYRIGPPDILQIDMARLIPRGPYKAEVFDVLQIRATNTLVDQPVDNHFLIASEGTVNLGPAYGSVHVAGLTIAEIDKAVKKKLSEVLRNPEVAVQLARTANYPPVAGQYLVGPDGTVNLRAYGTVQVAGLSVTEAKTAVERQLAAKLERPEASVSVVAFNSRVYYVITRGIGSGDNVYRLPCTGKEAVLDALAQAKVSIVPGKKTKVWLSRPSGDKSTPATVLPVDWPAISSGNDLHTNFGVLPGDRIFIVVGDAEGSTKKEEGSTKKVDVLGRDYH